jgi:ubiquinone/menaquinone biosynthesis C-methylase UbiE
MRYLNAATIFHLLYHSLAPAYDAVSLVVSLGHWREWGAAALPFLPGSRVLELGHGPGHLLVALAREGWQAVGVDLSPQMGRLARRRLARRGLTARLTRGQGQSLPFAAASFDGIVAVFPAPYILDAETVASMRRVLRPGGRLVIVPEAELIGRGPLVRAVEWLYAFIGQRGDPSRDEAGRQAAWGRLGEAGFVVTVHRVQQRGSVVTVVTAE